jgi:hypothetical protein
MKKKVMQTIFFVLFIAGIIIGYLLPGDFRDLTRKPLQSDIFDVPKRLGQLDMENEYLKYSILAETETGSVVIARFDEKVPLHVHPKENHFIYVFRTAQLSLSGVIIYDSTLDGTKQEKPRSTFTVTPFADMAICPSRTYRW